MKRRQLIGVLLVLAMFFGILGGCQSSDVTAKEQLAELNVSEAMLQELEFALQLGMPLEKVGQESVSGQEFTELLDWFVAYATPEQTESWTAKFPNFRKSTEPLRRFDAMAGLYLAAHTIGGPYSGYNHNIAQLRDTINHSWDEDYITWDLFGGFTGATYPCQGIEDSLLDGACYYYNLGRVADYNGVHPFALDVETNSFTPHTPPTYAEALLAIVRLISSANPGLFVMEPTEAELQYLQMAEDARNAFYARTSAAPEATGTCYYVSAEGSDSNDGLSPEQAWATPQHALSQKLKPGDAVLLRRGDVWTIQPSEREGLTSSALVIPEGVTLGAWGEGARPILQGAVNGTDDSDFWELYADENGAKIWKAVERLYYCPVIAFNGGESWATPVMPGVDTSAQYVFDDGAPFDVTKGLCADLQFCSLLDLAEPGINIENGAVTGSLYLRCDAGNPAEVFNEISIPQTACGLVLQSDAVITSVVLRYFTCNGAVMDGYDGFRGQTVYDCEVSWCGGLLKDYQDSGKGVYVPYAAGGPLQVSSTEVSVTDSYLHHCGPFTLIVAVHNNPDNPAVILRYENQRFANNLIEYCGTAVHMGDYAEMDVPGTTGYISNLVFENNLVMHSGMGWVQEMTVASGNDSATLSAFETNDSAIDNDGIYIRNNVFYKSASALFTLSEYHLDGSTPVNRLPEFSGNTYVQFTHRPILQKNRGQLVYYPTEENMKEVLGDDGGTLVCIG